MRGDDLDRKALLRRLINKLRADCIFYGADEHAVKRMTLEQLEVCRERRLKILMEEAPKGAAWPD